MTEILRLKDAPTVGVTRAQLRSRQWRTRSHGLYIRRQRDDELVSVARDLREVLPPGSAFGHLTGARLHDLWVPAVPAWVPVQASLPPRAIRPERTGLWVARSRARLNRPYEVDGLPVLPVPVLIGQLAEDLELLDLTVAIDSALHLGLCTTGDISAAIRIRQRGAPRLRCALEFADGRSESVWESYLRLFYVLTELADVEPQQVIYDAAGRFVARADLRLLGTRRISEYDGEHHRSVTQHRSDLSRDKGLARIGLERYGYTKSEILGTPLLLLRDAEQAYGLDHDPGRLAPWLFHAEKSTITTAGWNRFLHRLHRFGGSGGRKAKRPPAIA